MKCSPSSTGRWPRTNAISLFGLTSSAFRLVIGCRVSQRFVTPATLASRSTRKIISQVAWSASHTKETILSVTYRRWAKRLGKKEALVALGHKTLTVIYKLLKDGIEYRELWKGPEAA